MNKESIATDIAILKKSEKYPVTAVVLADMTDADMVEYESQLRQAFPGRLFVIVSCPVGMLNQLKIRTIFDR